MKNKLLILIIIILLPIAIFYNPISEEIFEEDKEEVIENKDIVVHLNKDNQIIDLSLNDYLIGVVGIEMPASFNIEALKAQAIAARTFAYNYLNNNEINITTASQNYIDNISLKDKWQENYDKYYQKVKQAVLSTDNMVIKYNNEIIKSYYYAMSNGQTEDSLIVFNEELPYISSVDSSFDENQKNFEVTTTFTYDNFCKLLNINPCNINVSNILRDNSNRVVSLNINNKEYLGTEFRKNLNLRSTDFIINQLDDKIEIITKGYGHGVGMSQYGANYLANSGKTYQEILNYYYKNINIENY